MFTRKPEDPGGAAPGASPARRFTDAITPATTIADGLRMRGALTGTGSVEIAGDFEGRVEIDGLCLIRASGKMVGPIVAGDLVVEGELQGRVTVQRRAELRASARVRADIEAATVAVAEGCVFDGNVQMPGGDPAAQPVTFREKRGRRGGQQPQAEAKPAQAKAEAPPPTEAPPPAAEAKPIPPKPKPPSATT